MISDRTKQIALGGTLGAAGVMIVLSLLGRSPRCPPPAAVLVVRRPSPNSRGEYGKKKHRHRRHHRG